MSTDTDTGHVPALGTAPVKATTPKIRFGGAPPPDRAAALPSLGGPPPRTQPPSPPPPPAPAPAAVEPAAAPARRPRPEVEAPPVPATRRGRATPRRRVGALNPDVVGVYLPPATLARLRAHHRGHADDPAVTYTSICLDAIEACQDRLADLFGPPQPPRSGPLFAGRVPRRVRHDGDPAQVTLTISAPDRAIIDELVEAYRCGSRSALFVKTLDAYLSEHAGGD